MRLYKDLLRYRPVWLGVALMWSILFHYPVELGPLNFLKATGYGGVDICIFASGIGCFYSLCSESNVVSFMKRRIKRLAPTYVVFIVFWLFYQYIIGEFGMQMALGNLLALQNFTGHGNDFNWYIGAIFLLYILAPYFKIVVDQATPVRKALFLAFLLICSIPFWNANIYIITITRIPLFYVGMLFADICKKNKPIVKKSVISLIAAFIVGIGSLLFFIAFVPQYLWRYGLYWYPFILITPPLCVAISYVSMILERTKITKLIVDFLSLSGDYSFELYLMHVPPIYIIPAIITKFNLSSSSHFVWAAGIICVPVGCFVLRRLAALLARLCGVTKPAKSKQTS